MIGYEDVNKGPEGVVERFNPTKKAPKQQKSTPTISRRESSTPEKEDDDDDSRRDTSYDDLQEVKPVKTSLYKKPIVKFFIIIIFITTMIMIIISIAKNNKSQEEEISSSKKVRTNPGKFKKFVFYTEPKCLDQLTNKPIEEYYNKLGQSPIHSMFVDINMMFLYVGASNANISFVTTMETAIKRDNGGDTLYIIRDMVMNSAINSFNGTEEEFRNITCLIRDSLFDEIDQQLHKCLIQMTEYVPNTHDRVRNYTSLFTNASKKLLVVANNPNWYTVPLGPPSWILTNQYKTDKIIFLDEIYPPSFNNKPNNFDLYNWDTFNYMVKVMDHLHQRGWTIRSFAGRKLEIEKWWHDTYPWVEITSFKVISYKDYIENLGKHTFGALHCQETFGQGQLELLQSGIPIITLTEHARSSLYKHMKNSILCSLLQSTTSCANLVEEFYDNIWSREQFNIIRSDANERFSSESFGLRLTDVLKKANILV